MNVIRQLGWLAEDRRWEADWWGVIVGYRLLAELARPRNHVREPLAHYARHIFFSKAISLLNHYQ